MRRTDLLQHNIHFIFTLILFAGSIGVSTAQAPSSGRNYIVETTVKVAGKKDVPSITGLPVESANRSIQYFDGLGRPLQTVQWQGSPTRKDIVQPIVYDEFGREATKYLPYAEETSYDAAFKASAVGNQGSFYNSSDSWDAGAVKTPYPFSKTVFEPSPLNRVLEQGAPGEAWQPSSGRTATTGRTVVTEYGTNAADDVRVWTVTPTGATAGFYGANKLYRTTVKDENWTAPDGKGGTTDEYKDFEGRVVLKRVWETGSKSLSTYYVYDDLGNLRYVLPPAVNEGSDRGGAITSFTESDTVFDRFIYGYHYDGRKRLTEKKIPGKGWEYMVYNTLDQVILSQDQALHDEGKWLFTKYDALGRTISTGFYSSTDGRASVQDQANGLTTNNPGYQWWEEGSGSGIGYTNNVFPQSTDYLTVNYYGNYSFPGNVFGVPNPVLGQATEGNTKGLLTGSKVRVLGTADMLLSVNYYDAKGQVVQTKSQHYKNSTADGNNYDEISNVYSFSGELKESIRRHFNNGTEGLYVYNEYSYDHMGRKLATRQRTGTDQSTTNPLVTLSKNSYNGIGQLVGKGQHSSEGSPFLQSTNYAYNERGWLKGSSSGLFSMGLKYSDGTVPQYNGNISQQTYTNGGSPNTFSYSYDKLNRLTVSSAGNSLGETISYDVMGNIKTLSRDGYGTNDYHISGYEGNRLKQISGFVNGSYTYNENGNLTVDGPNGNTIAYNYLNLPAQVTGSQAVSYTYDATGRKLRKQSATTGTTDYVDGIQYKTDGTIDFVQTEEGIARRSGNLYNYEYNLTDHLGNVRVSFYKNPSTQLLEDLQRDDYYAFGQRKVAKPGTNKYLYNGKELQDELGSLNEGGQYDYGARFYDPVIARFTTIDPLSETSRRFSPYSYALNNPIRFIDVDGMYAASPIYGRNGNFLGTDDEGLKGQAIVMNEKDFSQGMSHKEAISKSTYIEDDPNFGFANEKAALKYANHYLNLKNRPDYDGFVSINEGIAWAKKNPGALSSPTPDNALYLDASKLDFGNLSSNDMIEGVKGNINLFDFVDLTSSKSRATTYALGNTQMKLLNAKTGAVKLYSDGYDWDYHDKNYVEGARPPSSTRDRLIWGERKRAGLNDSHGFNVYMYGIGHLRK